MDDLKFWIEDIIGYLVGIFAIIWSNLPKTTDEWSSSLGLISIIITLCGITLPKIWEGHQKRRAKKRGSYGL